MIEIIKGDLIKAGLSNEIDFLLHGCNCFSTMGAGVARHIRSTWPSAYAADKNDPRSPIYKLGGYSYCVVGKLTIVNLYTQFDYGTDSVKIDYTGLRSCLLSFFDDFDTKDKIIGMPWIGCGLAGGDKKRVKEILHSFSSLGHMKVYEL